MALLHKPNGLFARFEIKYTELKGKFQTENPSSKDKIKVSNTSMEWKTSLNGIKYT